jgi:hypothetical protein
VRYGRDIIGAMSKEPVADSTEIYSA